VNIIVDGIATSKAVLAACSSFYNWYIFKETGCQYSEISKIANRL